MGVLDFLKKPEAKALFADTAFECKRRDLTIRDTEYRPEGEKLPVAIVAAYRKDWTVYRIAGQMLTELTE